MQNCAKATFCQHTDGKRNTLLINFCHSFLFSYGRHQHKACKGQYTVKEQQFIAEAIICKCRHCLICQQTHYWRGYAYRRNRTVINRALCEQAISEESQERSVGI